MKERPILFSAPMARAIRDGKKTQTRRVVKRSKAPECDTLMRRPINIGEGTEFFMDQANPMGPILRCCCPYGVPGDRLVFLTGWATEKRYDGTKPSELPKKARIWTWFDSDAKPEWCGRTRMGRHMPGWARAKMTRGEVVSVRVERVESISEADAIAEGCGCKENGTLAVLEYSRLWDEINGKGAWAANPWCWCVEFKVIGGTS